MIRILPDRRASRGLPGVLPVLLLLLAVMGCRRESPESAPDTQATAAVHGEYVGDDRCATCHTDVHAAFHESGMGRSLSPFDTSTAPKEFPDSTGEAVYDASNDLYYVSFVQGGDLYQREYRLNASGERIHELTYKADWVIGSGKATRTYLMVRGGYVTEMPLTWYVGRRKWDMSPGYRQSNPRFSRPVNLECMTCHSARPERSDFTQNHYARMPDPISCERCHGPGGSHVKRWADGDRAAAESTGSDSTIVNPADLTRRREMDVCLQCHLPGVTVYKDGEDPTTFRAGQPLAAHRTVYYPEEQIDRPRTFGIDSHPIRLANSACYKQSEMTCTTCHDSHSSATEQTRAEYNRVCKSCHGGSGPPAAMAAAADSAQVTCARSGAHGDPAEALTGDCISCHMQQGGTSDIPHIVFTDHWIRRDPPQALQPDEIRRVSSREQPVSLVRVRKRLAAGDGPHAKDRRAEPRLAELEAAVAYFKLFETKHTIDDYLPVVVRKAREGFSAGAQLPEARIVLGRALAAMDSLDAAEEVLSRAAKTDADNAWAHLWLGDVRLKQGRSRDALVPLRRARSLQPALIEAHIKYATALQQSGERAQAISVLEAATRKDSLHHPQAWNNLGLLYLQNKNLQRAAPALERAVHLAPDFVRARVNLGSLHLMRGTHEAARQQFERAVAADSTFAPAFGNLGLIYARQGNLRAARRMFERVLELRPGDRRARQMLQRLQNAR